MAYIPHYRLTMGGQFFDTETWSIGLRFVPLIQTGITNSDNQQVTAELVAPCATYVSSGSFSSQARLDWVKFNAIGSNGKQIGVNTASVDTSQDGIVGGGSANYPQLSVVVSLRTILQRGRASRGRIYPPGAPALSGSSGRLANSTCETLAQNAADWIDACNAIVVDTYPEFEAGIASNIGNPGPYERIVRVECGDVVDTQRRRRDQLPENYYGVDL